MSSDSMPVPKYGESKIPEMWARLEAYLPPVSPSLGSNSKSILDKCSGLKISIQDKVAAKKSTIKNKFFLKSCAITMYDPIAIAAVLPVRAIATNARVAKKIRFLISDSNRNGNKVRAATPDSCVRAWNEPFSV